MATENVRLGDPLPLDADSLTLLGGELHEIMDELEESHANYFSDISCWWSWYHATPDVEWRTSPFEGASNTVVPVIMAQADPQVAKTLLQLLSTPRFWTGTAETDEWRERTPSMLELLNWGILHQPAASLFDTLEPGICEQQVIGETIWEQQWSNRLRPVITPTGKVQLISFGQGPTTIHRPRERYLFPRTTTIDQADIVFVQDFYSTSQLMRLAQSDPKAIKTAFHNIDAYAGLEGAAADLENERRDRSGLAPIDPASRFAPHDVRTIHIEVQLTHLLSSLRDLPRVNTIRGSRLSEEVPTPCLITYHPKSRRILKAVYHPLLLDGLPFYQATRKRGGAATEAGRGLAKDLEQIQRIETAHFNQASDSITVANAIKLWTNDRSLVGKRWSPNQINFASNLGEMGLKEFGQATKSLQPDISLLQYAETYAQRVGGASDPVMGRESRMGGHPSPATNFLGMMQQAQINSSRSLKSLRNALSKMGEHRALMYQQFETNKGGWLGKVFGPKDEERILEFLDSETPLYGQVHFDIHAFSEIHNPDAERQKAITIYQMVSNHMVTVAKVLETISNPQAPPALKEWLSSAATGLQRAAQSFLEASEVDEWEDFIGQLKLTQQQSLSALAQLGSPPGPAVGGGGQPGVAGPPLNGGQAPLPGAGLAALPNQTQ